MQKRDRAKPMLESRLFVPEDARRSKENKAMMIYILAAAMTVAMLIATAFGMHQEALRLKYQENRNRTKSFGMH